MGVQAVVPAVAAGMPHIMLAKVGLEDKLEALIQPFEWTAEAWGWLEGVDSLPLAPTLSGGPANAQQHDLQAGVPGHQVRNTVAMYPCLPSNFMMPVIAGCLLKKTMPMTSATWYGLPIMIQFWGRKQRVEVPPILVLPLHQFWGQFGEGFRSSWSSSLGMGPLVVWENTSTALAGGGAKAINFRSTYGGNQTVRRATPLNTLRRFPLGISYWRSHAVNPLKIFSFEYSMIKRSRALPPIFFNY